MAKPLGIVLLVLAVMCPSCSSSPAKSDPWTAEDLHLARKPLFSSIIRIWAKDESVEHAYGINTAGRDKRLAALRMNAERVFEAENKRHIKRSKES